LQDLTVTDQIAQPDNAGLDNGGPKSNKNAGPDNARPDIDEPPLSLSCSIGQAAK